MGRNNTEAQLRQLDEKVDQGVLKLVKCEFTGCNFRTRTQQGLKLHKRVHETKLELRKPFPCPHKNCEHRAGRKGELQIHVDSKHTPGRTRNFYCNLCPARFYHRKDLREHISKHLREHRFLCKFCNFGTYAYGPFTRHVRLMHGTAPKFQCPFTPCTYSTKRRDTLRDHIRNHNPDPIVRRPFPCSFPDCNFRAPTSSKLERHMNGRHNPSRSRDFKCNLCSKAFYSECILRTHIRFVHTHEKIHHCSKCSYTTRGSLSLKRHMRKVHEDIPPILDCDSCEYRAFDRCQLRIHRVNVHIKQRRFKCTHHGCNLKTNYPNARRENVCEECSEHSTLKHSVLHKVPIVLLQRLEINAL